MKTLARLIVLILLFSCAEFAAAQSPVASLELYPISGTSAEVRIGARMTPQLTVMNIEAVSVAVAYDASLFSVNANTSIQNMYFAQYGWEDASAPEWQLANPGICVYGEYHPNFGSQAIFRGVPPTLCQFVFYPKSSNPGTANFTVYANNPTAALTYYFEYQVPAQQNFSPVTNITGMYFPVELSSFTAAQQGQSIALRWVTQTETGNYGFHVERREAAGAAEDWTTIGFVDGAGDSRTERQYLFFDWNLPHDGEYAYRLRQQDFDGAVTYTDAVSVRYVNAPLQTALRQNYPNPVSLSRDAATTVVYDVAEPSRVRLSVRNLLGQQIAVLAENELAAGSYSTVWHPVGIPAGTYIVSMTAEATETGRTEIRHLRVQILR